MYTCNYKFIIWLVVDSRRGFWICNEIISVSKCKALAIKWENRLGKYYFPWTNQLDFIQFANYFFYGFVSTHRLKKKTKRIFYSLERQERFTLFQKPSRIKYLRNGIQNYIHGGSIVFLSCSAIPPSSILPYYVFHICTQTIIDWHDLHSKKRSRQEIGCKKYAHLCHQKIK